MKTALCLSGRLTHLENYESFRKHIIEPYNADVFIDTWIPLSKTSIKAYNTKYVEGDMNLTKHVTESYADINAFAEKYQPKIMTMEHFDAIPLTHQIRSILPKNTKTVRGTESPGTLKENVFFMWYKIWKSNQMRKLYEQTNRIRYDCVIRARFDSRFETFPIIEPKRKTLYIPMGGDFEGGLNDQFALADSQTMDLYCELYNDLYRYSVAGLGIHPESMLYWHVQINRLTVEKFECGLWLRDKPVTKDPRYLNPVSSLPDGIILGDQSGTVLT